MNSVGAPSFAVDSASAAASAAGNDRTLEDEAIEVIGRQGRRVPVPVFLSSLLIALMAWLPNPRPAPIVWLAAVAAILALRWIVLARLPTLTRLTVAERVNVAVLLSAVNGIVQGSSVMFSPSLDILERAAQSLLMLGLCAGSVATTVGHRRIFLAFLVPTVLPVAAMWAFGPVAFERRWIAVSTALLILLFAVVLLALAKDLWRLFAESFEIRRHQIDLNRQLRAALEGAEAANRAKTRFLASASHDLRQPLHTLSLFSAALMMRPLDESARHLAGQMGSALKALGTQLDTLLDISKLDAGIVTARPVVISLASFLRQRETEARPLAEEKGLALTLKCPHDALCEVDEVLFADIVRNLVDNAIKYTESGWISLEVHDEGPQWILRIRDTGRGIPADEHERVFEEFYQLANPERDRTRGLGLGLSIVRRLATLLAIGLDMDSAPGRGTEFRLAIRRSMQPAAPGAVAAANAFALPERLAVLVLDDEEAVRQGMRALLEAHGCTVALASTPDEAAALAADNPPDIVVADLRLRGGEDGIRAIARLRAVHAELPALLVSGDTAPMRLQEAHAAGIRLLSKPVDATELRDAIACEIQRGSRHGHDEERYRDR